MPWPADCCERFVSANMCSTMKAIHILSASSVPRAAQAHADDSTDAPSPIAQKRTRRRRSRHDSTRHPSRSAMVSVMLAALFAFGVLAAFVVVAFGR